MINKELTLHGLNKVIGEAKGWIISEDDDVWPPYVHPDGLPTKEMPNWTTDERYALELLVEMNEQSGFDLNEVAFSLVPSKAKAEIVFNEYNLGISSVFAEAPTVAEAVARAWWDWKKKQND